MYPGIECKDIEIGENFDLGPGVSIKAKQVRIGDNVSIGSLSSDEAFRHPGGVQINVDSLEIGDSSNISRSVLIKGGSISFGMKVTIREYSTINVRQKLYLDDLCYISPYCRVNGRDIKIGKNFRMLTWANIGGGSCFEVQSKLRMGDNCHLGEFAQINTADSIQIGHEVGIGIRSSVFTHGAYQSVIKGYPVEFGPVQIGSYCWLPHAYVLPNVNIGEGTVVAAGSVVNKSLPPYSLAGGVPAKVIRSDIYKNPPSDIPLRDLLGGLLVRLDQILKDSFGEKETSRGGAGYFHGSDHRLVVCESLDSEDIKKLNVQPNDTFIVRKNDLSKDEIEEIGITVIDVTNLLVIGQTNEYARRVTNQLRRYGVRLR
ncbi:MAG: hypothetical protein BAJATHORv1_50150 [Candidatus Thorarchaeota archaeon]|nr:MAG: hypothetical protein BAJATHORv1_50150 [Candidatus Thorarchaeota archaeon]